jgi:multiple sugar transport system substrate-binding protein
VEIQRQIADGGIYGLPFSTSALALFYNKDLFDKFGVPYPKDGMTWEDAYELTKKMSRTVDGVRYSGMIVSISHTMMLDPLSPAYIDQKTNKALFSADKFKQAFQTLTGFYHIAGNEVDNKTKSYGTQLAMFQKDKTVAMFLGLNSLAAVYFADKDNLNWDIATYPHYKEQPDIGPQTYPNYFYVTKTSKYKDIAFQVIAYMTSEDFQRHLAEQGEYPILKNTDIMKNYGKNLSFMQNKHISALLPAKFAAPAFKGDFQSIGSTVLNNAYYQVILGQKDINTALRDADESIDKQIAGQLTE